MGNSSDPYDGLTKGLSTLSSLIVFVLGLGCTIFAIRLLQDEDFQMMHKMLKADAAWVGEPALTFDIDTGVISIIIVGILATLASLLGCLGAQMENHSFICMYFMGVVVLGVWFLIVLITVTNFNSILVPIADRQATQFCDVNQFYTFKAQLGCTFRASRAGGECGDICQDRVNLLREMDGGCDLLDVMCHRYEYETVGTGNCLVKAAVDAHPPTWANSVSSCEQACSDHVACSAYSVADSQVDLQACQLVMDLKPTYGEAATGDWKQVPAPAVARSTTQATSPVTAADGEAGYTCNKKDKPALINKAGTFSTIMVWMSAISAIVTCLAMCCTCSLLYTTSTRRKGKKGGCPLLGKLLCPCCRDRTTRKFDDEEGFESVDSDEKEYYE